MTENKYWSEPNLSPTDVKRQHYVPRMHLRRFVGPDNKLNVLDQLEDSEYRTSINNAALEKGFNDIDLAGEILSTEEWLSKLEGEAAPVIQGLVDDPNSILRLTEGQEITLARFLAALRFRTQAFRDWTESLNSSMLADVKEMTRKVLYAQNTPSKADKIWEEWQNRPEYWWFGQTSPTLSAETAAFMLGEVQGWANLLRGMRWRIGKSPDSTGFYTSDNPVAGYLPSVHPWWDHGAFSTLTYFVPLSSGVLLKVQPWPRSENSESERKPQGERRRSDFSQWETSIARHVITGESIRFLYGEGPFVSKQCASECMSRINKYNLEHAIRLQGFDPNPPKMPDFEKYMAPTGAAEK